MAWQNVQATLIGGVVNVSTTLTTSDYPDAISSVQALGQRGFWTNTAVGGVQNQFVPATSILFLTIS